MSGACLPTVDSGGRMRARGEKTRQAVIRAAEQVFAERGYAGARMDDVAAAVGIRRASLVYYYRDKRDLYRALVEDLFGGLLQGYHVVLGGPGSPEERMLGIVDVWSQQVMERPGLLRVIMWELARVPRRVNPALLGDVAPIVSALTDLITTGQRDGAFQPIDPARFMMVVAGATAFLTLGMESLIDGKDGLGLEDLREELRTLTKRTLFRR